MSSLQQQFSKAWKTIVKDALWEGFGGANRKSPQEAQIFELVVKDFKV